MADFWNAARGTLASVAPLLASAVGGPLAGTATGFIIKALHLAPDTAPEDVAEVIRNATPDQLLVLKQAEQAFAAQMKQLDIDAAALAYKDTADARAREREIKDHTPSILAYVSTAGFFGMLVLMAVCKIPPENKDLLNIMLGSLGACWGLAMSYYFGSSNKQPPIVTPSGK